jgi:hypothetical protein
MRYAMCVLVAGMSLGLIVPAAAHAEGADNAVAARFTVKLDRPQHAGEIDHYSEHLINSQNQVVTQNGSVVHEAHDFHEAVCEIRERVLQVSEHGRPIQTRIHFLSFSGRFSPRGSLNPLPLTGATIVATLTPKVAFQRSDGKPIDEDDLAFLNLLFEGASKDDSESNDAAFDPPGPVAVGETWKGDTAVLARQMAEGSSTLGAVAPANVTSNVTLEAKKVVNGVDCLVVHAESEVDPVTPKGLEHASGKVHMVFRRTAPIDLAGSEQGMAIDVEATIRGEIASPDGRMEVTINSTQHLDTAPLATP